MTVLLYIPSRGRYSPKELQRGVLADIPDEWWPRTMMVVPEDEFSSYLTGLTMAGYSDKVGIMFQSGVDGISATRQFCGQHAAEHGADKFVMLDDDIRFLVRRDADTWRMRSPPAPAEVAECLSKVERMLELYSHGGVSSRDGNNRVGVGSKDELVRECERYLRLLAFRTREFLSCEHGRVPVMEDFDVALQLLERGHPSFVLYYWAQGQTMTNAAGGCSTYRTHELHEAAAHKLAELHPGVVSLRTVSKKMDTDGFGTRTEVTIQWKKAYQRGLQSATGQV